MAEKVLVTGGTGFIGRYTADLLDDSGRQPVVMDRHMHDYGRVMPETTDVILGDVRDAVSVSTAVAGCVGVVHLAGVLGTQETVDNPAPSVMTNIVGTLNVLNAVREHDVPCVIISVGNHWMNNSYSITKSCAERLALMYRAEHDVPVCVVRALNAYGPGQKIKPVRKIIPTFVTKALNDQPIEVYGNGDQIMDMVYVEDVAEILLDALDKQPDGVVEAGTGRPTTVNEIAEAVIARVGRGSIVHLPMRPGETPNAVVLADAESLAPLGWKPERMITLEEGLVPTVESYRLGLQLAA